MTVRPSVLPARGFLQGLPIGRYALAGVGRFSGRRSDLCRAGVPAPEAGNLVAATRTFQQGLAADPGSRYCLFLLAQACLARFEHKVLFDEEEVEACEEALGTLEDPDLPDPHQEARFLLEKILVSGAQYERAAAHLALGPDPRVAFGLREFLGEALAARRKGVEVLAQYRKCLQIFPGYVPVVEKIDAVEKRLSVDGSGSPVEEAADKRLGTPSELGGVYLRWGDWEGRERALSLQELLAPAPDDASPGGLPM